MVRYDSLFALYTCSDSARGVGDDFYPFGFLFWGFDPLLKQREARWCRRRMEEAGVFETMLLVIAYISVRNLVVGRCCRRKRDEVEEFNVIWVENGSDFGREVDAALVEPWDVSDEGLRGTESEEDFWGPWGGHFRDINDSVNDFIRLELAKYSESG